MALELPPASPVVDDADTYHWLGSDISPALAFLFGGHDDFDGDGKIVAATSPPAAEEDDARPKPAEAATVLKNDDGKVVPTTAAPATKFGLYKASRPAESVPVLKVDTTPDDTVDEIQKPTASPSASKSFAAPEDTVKADPDESNQSEDGGATTSGLTVVDVDDSAEEMLDNVVEAEEEDEVEEQLYPPWMDALEGDRDVDDGTEAAEGPSGANDAGYVVKDTDADDTEDDDVWLYETLQAKRERRARRKMKEPKENTTSDAASIATQSGAAVAGLEEATNIPEIVEGSQEASRNEQPPSPQAPQELEPESAGSIAITERSSTVNEHQKAPAVPAEVLPKDEPAEDPASHVKKAPASPVWSPIPHFITPVSDGSFNEDLFFDSPFRLPPPFTDASGSSECKEHEVPRHGALPFQTASNSVDSDSDSGSDSTSDSDEDGDDIGNDMDASFALAIRLAEMEGGLDVQHFVMTDLLGSTRLSQNTAGNTTYVSLYDETAKVSSRQTISHPVAIAPTPTAAPQSNTPAEDDDWEASLALMIQLAEADGGMDFQTESLAELGLLEEDPNLPRACSVCLEHQPVQSLLKLPCERHYMCPDTSCLEASIKVAIQSRVIFKCCNSPLTPNILRTSKVATISLSSKYLDDYTLLHEELNTPSPLYCATPRCNSFIPKSFIIGESPACCRHCTQYTCPSCRTAVLSHHSAQQCSRQMGLRRRKEEEEAADVKMKVAAQEKGWKMCPARDCGRWVEKSEGCNHIKCKCGKEFCYRCGEAWSGARNGCSNAECAS